jgi:hypothetical protein
VATKSTPTYPHLRESKYAVPEPAHRKRYWYSASTLNQGESAGVVGFVWTHWCADRRLGSPGALDDDFALGLYRESKTVAGLDPDDETLGSWVWAGERVLVNGHTIEQSFSCPDIETLVPALLERGPVVAGLGWYESMMSPEEVDGRMVCRVAGQTSGGHAILLNGVDLDLELDGVRGFVRLKNSWGPEWGDDGQALVAIRDLATLLESASDVLLPIPARDALGAGGRQDVAYEDQPPGGYGPQSIGSDLWTVVDTVGYGAYAEAIARGIQHDETRPPLTIGIKAPWGAGKTSLMRMIRDRLEWPSGKPSHDLRGLHLVGRGPAAVTNRTLLERARSHDRPAAGDLTATPDAANEDERRWRPTVWFNPWMYQTGEQVWAGLAHEIITQVTERMPRAERERFWLELNVRRVDEQAVRRRIYALALERVLPWALGGLLAVIAGLGLLAVDAAVGAGLIVAGPGGVAVLAVTQLRRVLSAPPSGALAELVAPATEQMIHSPDYGSRTGVFYLLQADLQRVLDLVATPQRPLIVFVDDLDRCSPGTVVQVIEAINLFLAGQYPNCIFVIAMEPDMVAAHVEAAYGNLAQRLEQHGDVFELGWRFLEKIVQLPLTLPALEPERAAGFAESLFAHGMAPAPPVDVPSETPLEAENEQLRRNRPLSRAVRQAATVSEDDAAAVEEVRRTVERRLTIDDPEVREAIAYGARFLETNPREIKRFVNVFRFLVMIHTERVIGGLATAATLEQIAKLALLSTRWPSSMSTLAAAAGDGRTVYEVLETEGGEPPARVPEPCLAFLREEPMVGAAARHYL